MCLSYVKSPARGISDVMPFIKQSFVMIFQSVFGLLRLDDFLFRLNASHSFKDYNNKRLYKIQTLNFCICFLNVCST